MLIQDTRVSLLARLRENDHEVDWGEFYSMYEQAVLVYAKKLGLSHDQAYDVLQDTMVTLLRLLKKFEYDPGKGKFRSFLLTIVHRSCLKSFRREKKRAEIQASDSISGSTRWIEHFAEKIDHVVDEDVHIWREALFQQALTNITSDPNVKAETAEIFTQYALQGRSAKEVAQKFSIKENAIYQIKNRMIDRLRAEVDLLMNEMVENDGR